MSNTTLTSTMQPIIEAIGFDASLALVARYGGTRIPIRSGSTNEMLVHVIGADGVSLLVAALGPGLLEVPRCLNWLIARRNEEIIARALGGETQAELALRFNLTERHIRNILSDSKKEPPMLGALPLFSEGPSP